VRAFAVEAKASGVQDFERGSPMPAMFDIVTRHAAQIRDEAAAIYAESRIDIAA
jgi:hypothetical protein